MRLTLLVTVLMLASQSFGLSKGFNNNRKYSCFEVQQDGSMKRIRCPNDMLVGGSRIASCQSKPQFGFICYEDSKRQEWVDR
jgi:hypothetical protein